MKAFIFVILFSSSVFAGGPVIVESGNSVNNGGDAVAIEFTKIGGDLASRLNSFRNDKKLGVLIHEFQLSVLSTQVNTADNLILDGQTVDAINNAQDHTIVLNRTRWLRNKHITTYLTRHTLVIHEYLEAAGVSDYHYQISQLLVKRADGDIQNATF